jgi:hypothetical protein
MFMRLSHSEGNTTEDEILFSTRFDYLFPDAARSKICLLPDSEECTTALRALGDAMAADELAPTPSPDAYASKIPAIYTYFGQFIDHDITARTDRDGSVTSIGNNDPVNRLDPDFVVTNLMNGRRPELDLDSLFGDAPRLTALDPGGALPVGSVSEVLYDADFKLRLFEDGARRDVVRGADRSAVIPDMRNDENLNVSQLQVAMLKFYNRVHDAQTGSSAKRYVRARQLCRWAFQYVVIHDWLMKVCEPLIVEDTLANGPRFFSPSAGRGGAFMPLEFSAAGFRFAHSMIRPSYQSNATAPVESIMDLLGFAAKDDFFELAGNGIQQLKKDYVIDWNYFVAGGAHVQFARKIDTKISKGLGQLPLTGRRYDPVLGHLARANLLRGKNLSIPTGQAVADAFGITYLKPKEILDGEDDAIKSALKAGYLHHRTPLWYYVLREAMIQQKGERLGEVGSRIVCETLIGMIKFDLNSYFYNRHDDAVKGKGIDVLPGPGGKVNEIKDILHIAQVY